VTAVDIPVLVVGGGPVGLAAAHMFEQHGVEALVAEQFPGRLGAPKAHALNARSLEICDALGLPMDKIHEAATPSHEGACVRFVTNLTGREIGCLPYERQDDEVRAFTPWPLINIQQPLFEEILEAALAGAAHVRLQRELEWLDCEVLADSVVSTLRDHASGDEITIRSRYLIGADGAASRVRDAAGLKLVGPDALAHNITIHFEADLRELVKDRPAILYFLFGVGSASTLIAYDIGKTWVLMHAYDPVTQTADDFDQDTCEALLREAIGADVPFAIKSINKWVMTAQVANHYRSRNVFLVGDAAHRYPPTGGLGLNAGLADIENLAWKIAAVEQGEAGSKLLDTYDAERRLVAQSNSNQSVANAMRLRILLNVLGQEIGRDLDAEALYEALDNPAKQDAIRDAVAQQKEHFDSLRLQIGYIYGEHQCIDDDLPISEYRPRALSGAYLPHCVLEGGGSILDLVASHGLTLLVGREQKKIDGLPAQWHLPVKVLAEGVDFALDSGSWTERMGLPAGGALLLRPDRHILFAASDLEPATLAQMSSQVSRFLDIPAA
jgi:2-polyprenyl-6-methoxyphenol hydroxylase-like FAD-dependent oxidoreductase